MKIRKNIIVLGLLTTSVTSFGVSLTIDSFSIVRTGGGSIEIVVENQAGRPIAWISACNFNSLPGADQSKTVFAIKGGDALATKAILENKATLATRVRIDPAGYVGGTWLGLKVDYTETDILGKTSNKTTEIDDAIVVVDDVAVDVLTSIEMKARNVAKAANLCK